MPAINSKNVSIADIAAKLKLSKAAVSFALSGSNMVSNTTKQRVLKTAAKMGYKKSPLVSSLMSSIKRGKVSAFSETMALLIANADKNIVKTHPTLCEYKRGIESEAKRLGYAVDEIWIADPLLNSKTLAKALRARGIRGGVVMGHFLGEFFKPKFAEIWRNFSFVSVGVKTSSSFGPVVSADQYAASYLAFENCVKKGLSRVAIIMEKEVDYFVDGRFIAGFLRAQFEVEKRNRIEPFTVPFAAVNFKEKLDEFLKAQKPQAILYLRDYVGDFLRLNKIVADKKILLVQLENRRKAAKNWCGIEQNNYLVGVMAVRNVADILNRKEFIGESATPCITFVSPNWCEF